MPRNSSLEIHASIKLLSLAEKSIPNARVLLILYSDAALKILGEQQQTFLGANLTDVGGEMDRLCAALGRT
jgi:hypothetical protein